MLKKLLLTGGSMDEYFGGLAPSLIDV